MTPDITDPMLRVETKFKNARLFNAIAERSVPLSRAPQSATLHRMGPVKAFCELHGLSLERVYRLLNLRCGPLNFYGRVRPICSRLADILERPVEDLFPAALYAIEWPRRVVREIDEVALERLMPSMRLALPPTQEQDVTTAEMHDVLAKAIRTLTPREEQVITMRFGLDGEGERTFTAVGQEMGITGSRVTQIERRALGKLRHPSRTRDMRPFLE